MTYFQQSFSISYYRWVILALVLSFIAVATFNMFTIFYAKSLDMDMRLYGRLTTCIYAISLFLSYPLGVLTDRFHPLRTVLVAQLLFFILMIIGFFSVNSVNSFIVMLILGSILSGCFYTLVASLPARLFPQILFAQFNSAQAMILAIANVIFAPLFGWLLDRLNNEYRYSFAFAAILSFLAIFSLFKVYSLFIKFGGDANYLPPEVGGCIEIPKEENR